MLFLLFPIHVFAEAISAKDLYELQDICSKTCGDWFEKEWGNGKVKTDDGFMTSTYQSHYNKTMNKCFILHKTTSFSNKPNSNVMESEGIWDIQSNEDYGYFDSLNNALMVCDVRGVKCKSHNEWKSLIRTYMND